MNIQAKIAAEGGDGAGGARPRTHGDVPCGGFVTTHQIYTNINHDLRMMYSEYLRFTTHVYHVTLPYYNTLVDETRHRDLRVRYMMNEITKEYWRQRLRRMSKQRELFREVHQVYDMFTMTMHDLLMRAINSRDRVLKHSQQSVILKEIKNLIGYVNENLIKISKRYNNIVPVIFESQQRVIIIRNRYGDAYNMRIKNRLVPEIV